MAKKIPSLRRGLTIEHLLDGSAQLLDNIKAVRDGEPPWDGRTRYPDLDAIGIETVEFVLQRLIEHVDAGNVVTRQGVTEGLTTASKGAKWAKDLIIKNMNNGKLTPTLLDEIANA